jgi:hypothetical protein
MQLYRTLKFGIHVNHDVIPDNSVGIQCNYAVILNVSIGLLLYRMLSIFWHPLSRTFFSFTSFSFAFLLSI